MCCVEDPKTGKLRNKWQPISLKVKHAVAVMDKFDITAMSLPTPSEVKEVCTVFEVYSSK